MRKQELPDEQGAFDRWELKLSKQTAPLLKEWPDALLFLNFKTLVVATESNTHKAQGGKRVMFTSHHPCWDAKNRHGLPEEMELSYASIAPIFGESRLHRKLMPGSCTSICFNPADGTRKAGDSDHSE